MKKPSIIELLILNAATIFFVIGLIIVNVAVYLLFGTAVGLLVTGFTLIVVALIINYEQANAPPRK